MTLIDKLKNKLHDKMEYLFGLTGLIIWIILMIGAIILDGNLNPVFRTVSSLADGRGKTLFSIGFIISGSLCIPFYIKLEKSLKIVPKGEGYRKLATVVSIVSCMAIGLIGVIPDENLKHELETDSDTDGDGLSDDDEINNYQTDSNDFDTDGDRLSDSDEVNNYFTDPNDSDTDGDKLSDGDEVYTYFTDPNDSDTDGDGYSDGQEIHNGTDPFFPLSNPFNTLVIRIGLILLAGVVSLVLIIKYRKRKKSKAEIEGLEKAISENKAHPVIPSTPKIPDYTIQTKILKDEKRLQELNDSLFVYCPYCGTKMTKTLNIKFCLVCGKNIENDLNF